MRDRGSCQRAFQRLLNRAQDDATQAERLLAGRSRVQVANDPMRRDAVEQCVRRIGTITQQLAEWDPEARVRLKIVLELFEPLRSAQPIDRMDSDVLCGLVSVCRLHLRPAINILLQERPPS